MIISRDDWNFKIIIISEKMIQYIKETTTLEEKEDRIVYNDKQNKFWKHKKAKVDDTISKKLGWLFKEEISTKGNIFQMGGYQSISRNVCLKYKNTPFLSVSFRTASIRQHWRFWRYSIRFNKRK